MDEEIWKRVWLSGVIGEAEFRAMRKSGDAAAARAVLAGSNESMVEKASVAWGAAPVHCLAPDELPPRLKRAMSGSYLTLVGAKSSLRLPNVAIVGTRSVPVATARRLEDLIDSIVRASCGVISGGAYGVDTICQEAALRSGTPMTVVIAGGLLHPSPARNVAGFRKVVGSDGAVISDRSPTRTPHRRDFVRRNALIAALSDVVVVAAAPQRSGALETARVARRLGIPVLAVPGMFDDPVFEGSHQLLRDGAGVCAGAEDVLAAMGAQPSLGFCSAPATVTTELGEHARQVLSCLERGMDLDAIAREGLSAAEVQVAFLELELAGLTPR